MILKWKNKIGLFILPVALFSEEYAFQGKHMLASYYECDVEALANEKLLKNVFLEATRLSGATVLGKIDYHFEPDGMTMAVILSESHASIHTYPEHSACFVDLFTCGDNCSAERFDETLRAYLKPKKVKREQIERS